MTGFNGLSEIKVGIHPDERCFLLSSPTQPKAICYHIMQTQYTSNSQARPITVKFMARMHPDIIKDRLLRQFPGNVPEWGKCRFVFDVASEEYDWLVVYHDLYRERWSLSVEQLRCPRKNTILITTEPSTITVYGSDYLRQFGTILTSQEPWAISHPNPIFSQPGLIWFYGFPLSGGKIRSYDEMKATAAPGMPGP